jgi:hypothetical protein
VKPLVLGEAPQWISASSAPYRLSCIHLLVYTQGLGTSTNMLYILTNSWISASSIQSAATPPKTHFCPFPITDLPCSDPLPRTMVHPPLHEIWKAHYVHTTTVFRQYTCDGSHRLPLFLAHYSSLPTPSNDTQVPRDSWPNRSPGSLCCHSKQETYIMSPRFCQLSTSTIGSSQHADPAVEELIFRNTFSMQHLMFIVFRHP